MTMQVILVECDLISPAGAPVTLAFSDRAVFPMAPDDPDRPNAAWDDRLIEPPTLRRELFGDLDRLEPGLGVGVMTLSNADRALDAYRGHVWGAVRVWRWAYGRPFAEARALLAGRAGATPEYDVAAGRPGRVRLSLYDGRIELERPVQTAVFTGANDGETVFYEGDPTLKGRTRPLAYGDLVDAHIPAPLVNAGSQVFLLHDGSAAGLERPNQNTKSVDVFDRGADAGLSFDVDASHLSDAYFDAWIDAEESPPGYLTQLRRGLMIIGPATVGVLAFGFRGDDAAPLGYVETAAGIAAKVLARMVAPEAVDPDLAEAGSAAACGAYVDSDLKAAELVGWLARSARLAVLPDRAGVWRAVELASPAVEADIVLTDDDMIAVEADETAAFAVGEIRVGWGRIWTTYRRDNLLAELQSTEAETRLASEYRWAAVVLDDVQDRFSQWRTLSIETALRTEPDAEALAGELADLFGLRPDGSPRRRWRLTLEMTDAALDLELGATVALDAPGFDPAARYLLIGEEPMRPRRDQMVWTIWG